VRRNSFLLIGILLWVVAPAFAQLQSMADPENHPRIYGNNALRNDFIQAVNASEWKTEIVAKKKATIDQYVNRCLADPDWLRSRLQMNWKTKHSKVYLHGGDFSHSEGEAPVPTVRFSGSRDWATNYRSPALEDIQPYFDDERGMYLQNKSTRKMEWVHPAETGHIIEGINNKIMSIAQDAAFLYWYTGDVKYANFAAPIFDTYMKGMYYREAPIDLDNSNQQHISGLATFEVIHEQVVVSLALCYDFLYNYFAERDYDLAVPVAVFQRWGDQIIKNGVPDNNWNFFQARFLTYIALALDDNRYYENGKGQQYYLKNTFEVSSDRQIALKEAIRNYDYESGIWPECASYSMHVTETLLNILTLLDNATNANEFENFPIVEKATLASFQYLFPNGDIVAFGDSRHSSLPSESFEYLIANYRKYGKTEKEQQITALFKSLSGSVKRGSGLFELFFYVDDFVETAEISREEAIVNHTSPTFYAPNVSWFVQRMGTGKNATMVSTVGAMGNHAHANGIAIEIFADNMVLAPEMGKGPSYWHPDHRNYYSRYPAHNTVVVNGISDSEAMRVYHPFKMENHFPESGQTNNVFKEVTFLNASFVEPQTLANQQRITAIVSGTAGQPYILDVFRSVKTGAEKQKHEYFYHNLGQSLTFLDENDAPIPLSATNQLKGKGDIKAYDYFTDERSFSSAENVKAVFALESNNNPTRFMKVWLKGEAQRQYFAVKGPKSNALNKKTVPAEIYDNSVPALVVRENSEAWSKPFVAVFNPYVDGADSGISGVNYPTFAKNTSARAIQVTHSNKRTIDYIVVSASENDVVNEADFYMKGLLCVKRSTDEALDFIFAAGITRYNAGGWELRALGEPANISVKKCERGYEIQNTKAALVGIPKKLNPDYVEIYENDKLVEKRHGNINRNDAEKMDFKFEKAVEKAIVVVK